MNGFLKKHCIIQEIFTNIYLVYAVVIFAKFKETFIFFCKKKFYILFISQKK
jgi:hypothetical protein